MTIILRFLLLLKPVMKLAEWFMDQRNGARQQLILIIFIFL